MYQEKTTFLEKKYTKKGIKDINPNCQPTTKANTPNNNEHNINNNNLAHTPLNFALVIILFLSSESLSVIT